MPYILAMLFMGIGMMVIKSISGVCWQYFSTILTYNLRKDLYQSILRKHIAWHDTSDNAPGVMSALLQSDAKKINGVTAEPAAAITEAVLAILIGSVLGFVICWPITTCAFILLPVIVISAKIKNKFNKAVFFGGSSDKEEGSAMKQAQLLASDSIQNAKTVQSMANDFIITEEFDKKIKILEVQECAGSHCQGFTLGFSTCLVHFSFGILYYCGALLQYRFPDYKVLTGDKIFTAMFVILFGSFLSSQATAFMPDIAAAKKAAAKICTVLETPSKIDPLGSGVKISVKPDFKGSIEFKNVWFRYPQSTNQWVFRGLNLRINPHDNIAIVGESGAGKSTFINLVMRFYDPQFGEVLIDGVNVKLYNINELREKMGLVMQEPILFNYSIRENILYGKVKAANSEITSASEVANALEFIQGDELSLTVEDDVNQLQKAMEDVNFKAQLVEIMGQEKYDESLKTMNDLVKKEQSMGKFIAKSDLIDKRTDEEKGKEPLDQGFNINCGNKGSKLSGGQKQRVAIARAVIRQPQILLLDEATSALDERSQTKVQEALYNVMKDRTSIVIAHRLTTVERCNRVAVLEDGKIVEEGDFHDLQAKKDGYFANLASGMQSKEIDTGVQAKQA